MNDVDDLNRLRDRADALCVRILRRTKPCSEAEAIQLLQSPEMEFTRRMMREEAVDGFTFEELERQEDVPWQRRGKNS